MSLLNKGTKRPSDRDLTGRINPEINSYISKKGTRELLLYSDIELSVFMCISITVQHTGP